MDIKKMYYSLSKDEFDNTLTKLKQSINTLTMFKNTPNPLYYASENNDFKIKINRLQWEFDNIINSFSSFNQKQIIQSLLINEIHATNKIENINSAKHDIFSFLHSTNKSNNKIQSIVNSYLLLLSNATINIETVEDIRKLYDIVLCNAINKEDKPDGKLFRKNPVYVMDEIRSIHNGVYPESLIIDCLNDFLKIYNGKMETYEKAILTHYLFEFIHPFYDGNGRLGRFLMTYIVYKETKSNIAFMISTSLLNEKSKYYSAFKNAGDVHQFGFVNCFVENIHKILIEEIQKEIDNLKSIKEKIKKCIIPSYLTKTQTNIFIFILESNFFSTYGVTNEEIIENTKACKKTVISAIKLFREKDLLQEVSVGYFTYHKIKNKALF